MPARASTNTSPLLIHDDNLRLLLLGTLMLIYLCAGASIFSYMEFVEEQRRSRRYKQLHDSVQASVINGTAVNRTEFEMLLKLARQQSVNQRSLWDFAGSFHFCGTIVSTIGWGRTVPHTLLARLFVILYGIIGCSSGILFFNLFLERLIVMSPGCVCLCSKPSPSANTDSPPASRQQQPPDQAETTATAAAAEIAEITAVQRAQHSQSDRAHRSRANSTCRAPHRTPPDTGSTHSSSTDSHWRLSLGLVIKVLGVLTLSVTQAGALVFMYFEHWSYSTALYYTFVAFSTIGFGDFVAGYRPEMEYASGAYGVLNFLITALGVCCMYSWFNIISLIIRQNLDRIIACLRRQVSGCHSNQIRPTHRYSCSHDDTISVNLELPSNHMQHFSRRYWSEDSDSQEKSADVTEADVGPNNAPEIEKNDEMKK